MRKKVALTVLGVLAIVLVGCAAAPVIPGATINEDGAVVFSAEATSILDMPGSPLSEAKAEVAAATMAKANLLEVIKGAKVKSGVKVADLMFVSQEAEADVYGLLARANVTFASGPKRIEEQAITATATLTLDPEVLDDLDEYAY